MAAPISPIAPIAGVAPLQPAGLVRTAQPGVFEALLSQTIGTVQGAQSASHGAIGRFLSGEDEELHQVALAAQKAELSFELFMQVRNKVVQAYQDIMRMQI